MKPHEGHHLAVEHEAPDQWHRHAAQEGAPQAEHAAVASPKVLAIAFLAITFTISTTVLILVIFFEHYTTTYKAQQVENVTLAKSFNEYKSRWEETDSKQYGWADPKAGAVRIPMDKAMERVVEKYRAAGATAAGK